MLEDPVVYNSKEIQRELDKLNNTYYNTGGIRKTLKGCAIVGLIRFTEGFNLILVTKHKPIGVIGGHQIYAVVETDSIEINPKPPTSTWDKLLGGKVVDVNISLLVNIF